MELIIGKITGSLNETSWSQVHEFKPEDEKLDTHGRLIAAVSFKAKKEISPSSFGTEIITRLQEIYYSNQADSVLTKLSQTVESLAAEFLDQVELEIVTAVIWRNYLYAARNAGGQIWVKRNEQMIGLFKPEAEGIKTISGPFLQGDTVVAATSQFNQLVPEGGLRAILGQSTGEAINEGLAAAVHGHEDNSQSAALVVQSAAPEAVEPEQEKPKSDYKRKILAGMSILSRFKIKKMPPIFIGSGGNRKRRVSLTIGVVLLLVFTVSLVLAGRKRQAEDQQQATQMIVEQVNYKLNEANDLLSLNPLRAKSLLEESKTLIQEYKTKESRVSQEILDLEAKVNAALEQSQREYVVEATEWYDFDLVKEGFKGENWDLSESELLVWDGNSQAAVLLNLDTKAAAIVAAGEELKSTKTVGLTNNRGYFVGNNRVSIINTEKETLIGEVEADGWQSIVRARGFGGNLYLLDAAAESQIWKYLGLDEGLSGKRSYLTGDSYDLSEAVDMAIDGSVWVLFSDGTIAKYVQGKKDSFTIVGLDSPLTGSTAIFTSPETEHLYLLDKGNTRVVVIDKSGSYVSQYSWAGIAGARDMAVVEAAGKAFFLTGQKVFTIDLKL